MSTRTPLSRERVLRAAVELADEQGLSSLSMRRLGQSLGVEAMSLYRHVANKEDLLDGIVDLVVREFDSPLDVDGSGWRATLRRCAIAERTSLLRHPWAPTLAESRTQSSPERLRYYDALMGMLREAGFSDMSAYRSTLVLDSYVYGFALQEVSWPAPASGQTELESAFLEGTASDDYPNLAAAAALHADGQIDIAVDFEVCLDLILDSLERLRERDLGA